MSGYMQGISGENSGSGMPNTNTKSVRLLTPEGAGKFGLPKSYVGTPYPHYQGQDELEESPCFESPMQGDEDIATPMQEQFSRPISFQNPIYDSTIQSSSEDPSTVSKKSQYFSLSNQPSSFKSDRVQASPEFSFDLGGSRLEEAKKNSTPDFQTIQPTAAATASPIQPNSEGPLAIVMNSPHPQGLQKFSTACVLETRKATPRQKKKLGADIILTEVRRSPRLHQKNAANVAKVVYQTNKFLEPEKVESSKGAHNAQNVVILGEAKKLSFDDDDDDYDGQGQEKQMDQNKQQVNPQKKCRKSTSRKSYTSVQVVESTTDLESFYGADLDFTGEENYKYFQVTKCSNFEKQKNLNNTQNSYGNNIGQFSHSPQEPEPESVPTVTSLQLPSADIPQENDRNLNPTQESVLTDKFANDHNQNSKMSVQLIQEANFQSLPMNEFENCVNFEMPAGKLQDDFQEKMQLDDDNQQNRHSQSEVIDRSQKFGCNNSEQLYCQSAYFDRKQKFMGNFGGNQENSGQKQNYVEQNQQGWGFGGGQQHMQNTEAPEDDNIDMFASNFEDTCENQEYNRFSNVQNFGGSYGNKGLNNIQTFGKNKPANAQKSYMYQFGENRPENAQKTSEVNLKNQFNRFDSIRKSSESGGRVSPKKFVSVGNRFGGGLNKAKQQPDKQRWRR